jgi:energy-coupling factor transporter ATP-binding protein EcfA2
VKALQLLRKKHSPGLTIVGLGGPSGSGKSSLAKKIREVVPNTLIISLDNYLDSSRKVIDRNFDDYRLVDFDLVRKNLQVRPVLLRFQSSSLLASSCWPVRTCVCVYQTYVCGTHGRVCMNVYI